MAVVYKYEIQLGVKTLLDLPPDSKFLDAAFQGNKLQTWWLISEPTLRTLEYKLFVVETGRQFDTSEWKKYLKTVHTDNGDGAPYVCHVFQA